MKYQFELPFKCGDEVWTFKNHYSTAKICEDFDDQFLTPILVKIKEICFFSRDDEIYNGTIQVQLKTNDNRWPAVISPRFEHDFYFHSREEALNFIDKKRPEMLALLKSEIEKANKVSALLNSIKN